MRQKILILTAVLLLTSLVSCTPAPYALVAGRYTATPQNFAVDLPRGWRQHNSNADWHPLSGQIIQILDQRHKLKWDVIRLTRDGLLLQQISIGRIPVDEELPYTRKALSRGMAVQEAAEVIADDLRVNPNVANQEILENIPASVGGHSGFKLHYSYRTKDGLKMEGIHYGTIVDRWLYYLLYEAPAQHYFAKDRDVLEKMKESLQIERGAV